MHFLTADSVENKLGSFPSHPFCSNRTTLSSGPSSFRIHLMPCCCGSMISGQRSLVVKMAAFSFDIRSFGKPWLCQAATVASSVSMMTGSRPSVRGTETWNQNRTDLTGVEAAVEVYFSSHTQANKVNLSHTSLKGFSKTVLAF